LLLVLLANLLLRMLLQLHPVLFPIGLLHLYERSACTATRRCNSRWRIFIFIHNVLLLLQKLRWRGERRCSAAQPLTHAQSPEVTARDNVRILLYSKDKQQFVAIRFFSGRGKCRTLFNAGNFVLAASLTAGLR
jgi:hypothetical protein